MATNIENLTFEQAKTNLESAGYKYDPARAATVSKETKDRIANMSVGEAAYNLEQSGYKVDPSRLSSVSSSQNIAKQIQGYQSKIAKLNQQLTDTSNFYWNQQQAANEALTGAEKELQKRGRPDQSGLDKELVDEGGTADQQLNYLMREQMDYLTNVYDAQIKNLDQYAQTLDDQHTALVRNIQETYDTRRQQQIQENTQRMGGQRVAGIRSGRTRYAPEMQEMIMSEQERANMTALLEIDREERGAIFEANQAFNEGNFKLFAQKMETIEGLEKMKMNTVQEMYNNVMEYEQFRLQEQQAARQARKEEFDMAVNQAELYAPMILRRMTGDPDKDQALIESYARQLGVDSQMLQGQVETALFEIEQSEAEAARKVKSGLKVITKEEADKNNLPYSTIGLTLEEVGFDTLSPLPPRWFVDMVQSQVKWPVSVSGELSGVQELWQEYRMTYPASVSGESKIIPTYDPEAFSLSPIIPPEDTDNEVKDEGKELEATGITG